MCRHDVLSDEHLNVSSDAHSNVSQDDTFKLIYSFKWIEIILQIEKRLEKVTRPNY